MTGEKLVASAPGKVILFGEHFVVKGVPAIAFAVNLRATVTLETRDGKGCVELFSKKFGALTYCVEKGVIRDNDKLSPYLQIISDFLGVEKKLENKDLTITLESTIPPGSGLGSSAATSVALAAALMMFSRNEITKDELIKWSMTTEKIFHGNPSGIDVLVSIEGGYVEFENLNSYRKISPKYESDIEYLLVDTGIPRNTREAVLKVLEKYERYTSIFKKIYEAAREISRESIRLLNKGDYKGIGELMNINHGLLSSIGVSFKEAESIIYTARKNGALGAKITGAGLGGTVIILVEKKDTKKIIESIKKTNSKANIIRITHEQKGVLIGKQKLT